MRGAIAFVFVLIAEAIALGAGETAERARPKEVGFRTVVVEFAVDPAGKPGEISVVSSEASGLDQWAKALVVGRNVKPGSPGVAQLENGRFRARISFPLKDDGVPLAANIVLPERRPSRPPRYPSTLARANTSGGAIVRFTITTSGNVADAILVKASHKEFGRSALEAVKTWRFDGAAEQEGAAVEVSVFQLFTFEILGQHAAPWEWQMCPEPALPVYSVSGSYVPIPL